MGTVVLEGADVKAFVGINYRRPQASSLNAESYPASLGLGEQLSEP